MFAGFYRTTNIFNFSSPTTDQANTLLTELNILLKAKESDSKKIYDTCVKLLEADFHLLNNNLKTQFLQLMMNEKLRDCVAVTDSMFADVALVKRKLEKVLTAEVTAQSIEASFQALSKMSFIGSILYIKRGTSELAIRHKSSSLGVVACYLEQNLKLGRLKRLNGRTLNLLKNHEEINDILDEPKTKFPAIRNFFVENHLLISRSRAGSIQEDEAGYISDLKL